MNVLFTGLGSIASRHIKNIYALCCSKNIFLEISVLRRKITPLCSTLNHIPVRQITKLDNTVYDLACITNPTVKHFDTILMLENKTKFFFIEKPIFHNLDCLLQETVLTEKNSYIAAPLRFTKIFLTLQKLLRGSIVFSSRIICSSYLPDWRPNIDYRKNYSALKNMGGGVSLDLVHEMDYAIALFGFPKSVCKYAGKFSSLEITSDDLAVYVLQYEKLLCEIHLDYFGRPPKRVCEVFTDIGTITADFNLNIIQTQDGSSIDCTEDKNTAYLQEMDYILSFMQGKKNNVNSPNNAYNILSLALKKG